MGLPMCIYTGLKVPRDDWSYCPVCKFVCKYTEITKSDYTCPMCSCEFQSDQVVKVLDIQEALEGFRKLFK